MPASLCSLAWLRAHALSPARCRVLQAHRQWLQRALADLSPSTSLYASAAATSDAAATQCGRRRVLVLPYGSTQAGTAFDDADVDYAVITMPPLPPLPSLSVAANAVDHDAADTSTTPTATTEQKVALLAEVHAHLLQHSAQATSAHNGGALASQRVLHARVPVLRCTHTNFAPPQATTAPARAADASTLRASDNTLLSTTTVMFDLSVSLYGVYNTLLLRQYCEGDAVLRYGLLVLKQWAQHASVCGAQRGLASQYMFAIMYVHYMLATQRTRVRVDEQRIVATVHDAFVRVCAEDADASTSSALAAITPPPLSLSHVADGDDKAAAVAGDTDVSESRVHDDVRGFFAYYSGAQGAFDLDEHVADVRQHETMATRDEWQQALATCSARDRHTMLGHGVLFVRDPFEPHNLACGIDFFNAERIREALRVASAAAA